MGIFDLESRCSLLGASRLKPGLRTRQEWSRFAFCESSSSEMAESHKREQKIK